MFKLPEWNDIGAKVLLERCMECHDEIGFHQMLEKLILNHAMPLFRGVIARKVTDSEERESIYSEVRKRLIDRVTLLRARRGHGLPLHSDPIIAEARRKQAESVTNIREFGAYCRMLARQAFSDYLEQKYPERRRLTHRLRYLLDSQNTLCRWSSAGETVCGWAMWRDSGMPSKSSARLERLESDALGVAAEALGDEAPDQVRLGVLVGALLRWVGHPVPLQIMVDAVADILCLNMPIQEVSHLSGEEDQADRDIYTQVVDPAQDVEKQLQARAALQLIWERIRTLPLTKRRALLLGMRGPHGESALKLMPPLQVAGHQEIAAVLEIPWEEFARLWRELPLDDVRIAAISQTTPNNVRVQRHDARERLAKQQEV